MNTLAFMQPDKRISRKFAPARQAGARSRSGRHGRQRVLLLLACCSIGCLTLPKLSGEASSGVAREQEPRREARTSARTLESSFAEVLSYVDDRGLVRYTDLKAHRRVLDDFARQMKGADGTAVASWPAPDQIAFWINAYNGLTLLAVVDHYPIEPSFWAAFRFPANSIRQISGVWDELQFDVAGRRLTLDDIEHHILRRDFDEPRIHMALVCAALGCPPLRAEPYSGDRLDAQLDDQSRRFLSNPAKCRIDPGGGVVELSPIFDWYGADFIGRYAPTEGFAGRNPKQAAVLNFISRYVGPRLREFLRSGAYQVRYSGYDWSLNEKNGG